jgi:excisionase family DNA binding protein
MSIQTENRYMGYSAAAKYLGISLGTLGRWVEAGRVRSHRVGEKLCRFDRVELDRFVHAGDHGDAGDVWATGEQR